MRIGELLPVAFATLLLLGGGLVSAKRYKEGDSIVLFANKVGPFNNPSES